MFSYGTFFTPGVYSSFIFKPSSYVNPKYVSAHPFDSGCFEIIAEFAGDTTIIYMGTPCVSKNLNEKFQLIDLPNAFGEKNWISIKDDRSGKYLNLDCNLSEM